MDNYENSDEDKRCLIIDGVASTLILLIVLIILMYFFGFNPFLL